MSKRRKQRKKQQRKRAVSVVLFVVFLFIALAGVVVYRAFFYKKPIESYFPENPVFYAHFNLTPSLLQARNFEEVSKKFPNPDIFVDFARDFVLGNLQGDALNIEPSDITGWIGTKLVIGNIPVSAAEVASVMVVDVRNEAKAEEFLSNLKKEVRQRGDAVEEFTFREETVVVVSGQQNIAYSLIGDYILISRFESGVKKMIDVGLGAEPSLKNVEAFQQSQKALNGHKQMVHLYFDLVDLTGTLLNTFSVEADDFLAQFDSDSGVPSGLTLAPEQDGFKVKIFAYESRSSSSDKGNVKEQLTQYVPYDIVFYSEGHDLSSFINSLIVGDATGVSPADLEARTEAIKRAVELEFGINVNNDILPLVSDSYAFSVLRGNEQGNLNVVFLSQVEDGAEEKMLKIEDLVLSSLKRLSPDDFSDDQQFVSIEYDDVSYRRLSLPDRYGFDLYYFIRDNIFTFATTESAVQTMIDHNKDSENLADDVLFRKSVSEIDVSRSRQLIYFEPQAGLKLFDDLTGFDYGYIDQEYRLLESLGLKTHKERKAVVLEGFLKIKD